ncbi:uncharacterized protein LOC134311709 [Trichomycterus rosablanca]|uniref:uncharacterized protein LOC134311709 n=1 Tax=Trichomycterus rosablanca TaxID=2290929 RepID=UPI002F350E0D
MLYNEQNESDIQTHTQLVNDNTLKVKFGGLVPGQKYCARAQFVSSPSSDPQCIHIPVPERPNLFRFVLCGMTITLLIVLCVLGRRCFSTDLRLPKSLISLLDQEASVPPESRPETSEEEGPFIHLSIVSIPSMVSLDTQSIHTRTQNVEDRYYTAAILQYQACHEEHEDPEINARDLETDGELCSGHYPLPRWSSLPAPRPGMVCLLGESLPLEDSLIPLSSVRVAGLQMDKMEPNYSVKALTHLNSNDDLSSLTDVAENNTLSFY